MHSFKTIRQSITSFMTGKKPSSDQKPPEKSVKKLDRRVKKRRSDISMNSFYKAKRWLTGYPVGNEGNTNSQSSNTSKSLKRRRSTSTSPSPRKRLFVDQRYVSPVNYNEEEDLDGPTLVDDEGNDGDTEKSGPLAYTPAPESREARHSALEDLDGDTVMEGEQTPESEENRENRESRETQTSPNGLDDENGADGDNEYSSTNSLSDNDHELPGGLIEMPELDRRFTGFDSDDEFMPSENSSEEASEDEMIISAPTRGRSSRASGSVQRDHEAYRPSPDVVDRNLTSDIVSRNAEESDLSEEEVVRDNVAVRKDDRKEVAYDQSMENARRWVGSVKLPKGHWTRAESDLYFRLAMRGFEPIIPSNWKIDFATLPDSLFARPGATNPYIHSIHETEFRAIKFLSDLLYIGNRVRDRALSGFRPEPAIGRYVANYIKWALRDANLHNRPNYIPTYAMYALRGSQNSRCALEILNRRLVTLANRYREAWRLKLSVEDVSEPGTGGENAAASRYLDRKFPIITGFLICGPMIAVLTLNSDPADNPDLPPDAAGKFISQFDFSRGGQDVWNALAIAISVIRLRKNMLELIEDCPDDPMWMVGERTDIADPDL